MTFPIMRKHFRDFTIPESFIYHTSDSISYLGLSKFTNFGYCTFRNYTNYVIISTVLKSHSENRSQQIIREGFAEVLLAEWVSS